ncbi:MAG: rhodanese [Planctomycetes bacterium]|nr:rhodanese [Planctomycetota bacterium]MCB9891310.1 rhodanese [Planctomycetota bacterium]MCB9919431.1 rhodanese [Planctomycetota bacterium]
MPPIENLSASECAARLAGNEPPVLLDVRTPREHRSHRIPGATAMPLHELADRVDELDPDRPVLVYCEHGVRSLSACAFLAERGFRNIANLQGGIVRWNGRLEGEDVRR